MPYHMIPTPYRVRVTFIMLDPNTDVPVSGPEAVKVLGDMQTLTAFETAGLQASQFEAAGKCIFTKEGWKHLQAYCKIHYWLQYKNQH